MAAPNPTTSRTLAFLLGVNVLCGKGARQCRESGSEAQTSAALSTELMRQTHQQARSFGRLLTWIGACACCQPARVGCPHLYQLGNSVTV